MFKEYLFVFVIVLCFVLQLKAQDILTNGEIPDDVVISMEVKSTNRPPGTNYTINIRADGEWIYNSKDTISKKGVSVSGKVEKSQIKELILEFEKLDFFDLKNSYDGKNNLCENHQNIEIISIKFSKHSKQVSNYLGCQGNIQGVLANLGKQIRKITISK